MLPRARYDGERDISLPKLPLCHMKTAPLAQIDGLVRVLGEHRQPICEMEDRIAGKARPFFLFCLRAGLVTEVLMTRLTGENRSYARHFHDSARR